jgi:putative addiction module antidote
MTTSKIRKIGNSQGVLLPKEVLGAANADVGDEVEVKVTSSGVIKLTPRTAKQVEKARALAKRYRNALRELAK